MKLKKYTNMKHAGRFCPTCKTSEVSLYDEFHGETFCTKCGLILHQQNTRKTAVEYINETKNKEKEFRTYLKQKYLQ